ncbi:MAG: ABC transporter substrate-binding protein [Proteobacteria bacterium]|nr:ABC transporter substrate-binding protein [Pseudomonadota bacterium]
MIGLTRRQALMLAVLGSALAAAPAAAEPRHGISIFGDLKYPADFKNFEYVNPDAPKAGRLVTVGNGTFDSFNGFILKGDAAQGITLLYDTLMASSGDEPGSAYGLLAESADVAPDKKSVTFKLRPEARFSDGSQVTSADVVFTFETLKAKGAPGYRFALRDVAKAEAQGPLVVRFTFDGDLTRDLPITVAGLSILPKAYYDKQPFDETTLKVPVGSGPYTIGDFKQGGFVTYKRRDDYWAAKLPVNRGRYNFNEIRYDYFRDRTAELESLKAGGLDMREEFTARDWVGAYDIPAVKQGRLIKLTLPDDTPSGVQGFFFNTRREKFQDPRVRQALASVFDYEWTNANIFSGLYTRTESYFENSDMKAKGPPSPGELKLLEPFKSKLPASVFGEPYVPPKTDGSGNDRKQLRAALKMLDEAGWKLDTKGGAPVLRNAKGETLDMEFLDSGGPTMERVISPYIKNLAAIGVRATLRNVDPAQYQRRVKSYDFDIISSRFVMSLTPGVELYNYWGSEAASAEGTQNIAGIKDPVIDALIGKVIEAKSRAELDDAARAIDRVLRAGQYWVPHWFKPTHFVAYWDKYDRPKIKPKYERGITDTWWYDEARAAKLGQAR